MSWETSLTLSYIGAALILLLIASMIKEFGEMKYLRYFTFLLKAVLFGFAIGFMGLGLGVQRNIIETTNAGASTLLNNTLTSGIILHARFITFFWVVIGVIAVVTIVEAVLRNWKSKKGEEDRDEYDKY